MSEWRPIETAPKDGRRIIAFITDNGPYDGRVIAYWAGEIPAGRDGRYHAWQSIDEQCGGEAPIDPSHWLPLPEAPQS